MAPLPAKALAANKMLPPEPPAAVILQCSIATRTDPAIDRQCAADNQANRPTAFTASAYALPAATAAAAAVNGLLCRAISDAAGQHGRGAAVAPVARAAAS